MPENQGILRFLAVLEEVSPKPKVVGSSPTGNTWIGKDLPICGESFRTIRRTIPGCLRSLGGCSRPDSRCQILQSSLGVFRFLDERFGYASRK